MFKIGIKFTIPTKFGLQALDWRRARGLPDESYVYAAPRIETQWATVSEAFARLHFCPAERSSCYEVPGDWLVRGELTCPESNKEYVGVDTLPASRIEQLWLAAKALADASA